MGCFLASVLVFCISLAVLASVLVFLASVLVFGISFGFPGFESISTVQSSFVLFVWHCFAKSV